MNPPDSKTKVLHLITLSVIGGSQDNTFSTAELHDRSRYQVHLAANPGGHWMDRARQAADRFHPIPTLVTPIRPWHDLRAFLDILRLLRRHSFDLVHTHTAKAGFLGRVAAWLCRVPVVVHTYHAFPFHDFMPAWKRALFIDLERAARPLTDYFITVSENERMLGRQTRVLNWSRSQTIYSGIDFTRLDQPSDPDQIRRQLLIPPESPVVLMAGRLDAQKAPHLLVRAFREVADRRLNALLLIAGDGELRSQVEDTIQRLGLNGQVRVLGFRPDVPDLIKCCDVFALSSLWEGMGRAMTEAMLLAKPVVVPATNGIPEIVHHGKTGLLYRTGDVDELARQLIHLLEHPQERHRLGHNARLLTRELFDVRTMVSRIELVYEQLLQKCAPVHGRLPLPPARTVPAQS